MDRSERTTSLGELEAGAEAVLRELDAHRSPVVVTVDGQPRAVLQDFASYEATQETLAMLTVIAMGEREIQDGRVSPITDVAERIRKRAAR